MTNIINTVEVRNEVKDIITFSSEPIITQETFKAVNKNKLMVKCEIVKQEVKDAQKMFDNKINQFFELSKELNNMEV